MSLRKKLSTGGPKKNIKSNDDTISHPCAICSKACVEEINCSNEGDFSIECDNCKRWIHRKCLDMLSDKEWELLTGQNPSILFKCQPCVEDKAQKNKEIKEIKKDINNELSELREKFTDFQSILQDNNKTLIKELEKTIMPKVESIIDQKINDHLEKTDKIYEDKFKQLEKQLKDNKTVNANNNTQETLEKMMSDVKKTEINLEQRIESELKVYMNKKDDKEKRKNNIIILRLDEHSGNSEEEKIEKDRTEIKKLLNITNPELEAELENVISKKKSLRLGKSKEGAKRPIKLELPDEDMKKDIFKGCRKLKGSAFSHVSIQNDLTKEEQETNYKMRQELRQRKENGEKVCIYNNEIILEKDHPRNKKDNTV